MGAPGYRSGFWTGSVLGGGLVFVLMLCLVVWAGWTAGHDQESKH